MKTFFLTVVIAIITLNGLQAQDIIIKKSGEELDVKVTEISSTELKYLKPGLSVAFVLPLTDVLLVRFENGEKFIPKVAKKVEPEIKTAKISAGTAIIVISNESLSSKKVKVGTTFGMSLKEDVLADDGKTVIALARSQVIGTIVKSERNKALGKKGEIGFTVDYIRAIDGQRIPVTLNFNDDGKSRGVVVAVTALIAAPFLLLKGKAAKIQAGTQYKAYTSTDRDIVIK
jgi:hypothetical protein